MNYYSFLLRIWQPKYPHEQTWLASLESPGTHELLSFTDLDLLLDYLKKLTSSRSDSELGQENHHLPDMD